MAETPSGQLAAQRALRLPWRLGPLVPERATLRQPGVGPLDGSTGGGSRCAVALCSAVVDCSPGDLRNRVCPERQCDAELSRPPEQKKTHVKGWSDPDLVQPEIPEGWNRAERLDHKTDIDPDCREAVAFCPELLPPTECSFGRPTGVTHYFYDAPGSKNEGFKDEDGNVIIEIRTGTGHYTVIPPSHVPRKSDPSIIDTLEYVKKGSVAAHLSPPGASSARWLRSLVRAQVAARSRCRSCAATSASHATNECSGSLFAEQDTEPPTCPGGPCLITLLTVPLLLPSHSMSPYSAASAIARSLTE